jgi:hypothetical protein
MTAWRPGIFRYEAVWETHEELKPLIEQAWRSNACVSMQGLVRKLKGLSGDLSSWGRETFGSVHRELKTLRRNLETMRAQPGRVGPSYEELKTVERIVELQHREEIMWRQRSQIQWLAEGDKNTRFFHLRASKRKKRNKIYSLTRQDGSTIEDQDELCQMTRDFYRNLYTSEGTSGMDEVLASVPVSVMSVMNESLTAPFEDGEIKQALF